MTWLSLLGGLIGLAQLFFKAKATGDAARLKYALDALKRAQEASDEEIRRANEAAGRVGGDPHAGEL